MSSSTIARGEMETHEHSVTVLSLQEISGQKALLL